MAVQAPNPQQRPADPSQFRLNPQVRGGAVVRPPTVAPVAERRDETQANSYHDMMATRYRNAATGDPEALLKVTTTDPYGAGPSLIERRMQREKRSKAENRTNEIRARGQAQAARDAQIQWANQIDPGFAQQIALAHEKAGGALAPEQLRQLHQQFQMNLGEQGLLRDIDAYFTNPELAQRRQKAVDQQTEVALGDLGDQTRDARRAAAILATGQGTRGSSMDYERQSDISATRDRAAAGVADAGRQALRRYMLSDQQKRDNLRRLALSRNGADAQAAAAQLAGAGERADSEMDRDTTQQQIAQVGQSAQVGFQNAIAGGMNAFASGVRKRYGKGDDL